MKKILNIIFYITFLFGVQTNTFAQPDSTKQTASKLVKIIKHDETEYIGEILSDDGREVLIKTKTLGKIYIPKADIRSINPVNDQKQIETGNFRDSGPFTTRYHFTTNALPIKKGEDYALINLYGPEVHFSVNDQFSAGVMTSWIGAPFVGAFKYTIPTSDEKLNFGVGALVGTSGYLNSFRGYGGLYWGMVTAGNRIRNITLSVGFAHVDLRIGQQNFAIPGTYFTANNTNGSTYPQIEYNRRYANPVTSPVISIGGFAMVGRKASFIFDSMLFFSRQKGDGRTFIENLGPPDANGFNTVESITVVSDDKKTTFFYLMPGMRFQKNESNAFQVALAGVTYARDGNIISFPAPTCSWFIKF